MLLSILIMNYFFPSEILTSSFDEKLLFCVFSERIYDAWKVVTRSEHPVPAVKIPSSYHVADVAPSSASSQ